MAKEGKRRMEDFIDFARKYRAVVKPVIIGNELVGWITWQGGHTLNFWNTDFENADTREVGDFVGDNIPFEVFIKKANEWIEEIEHQLYDE